MWTLNHITNASVRPGKHLKQSRCAKFESFSSAPIMGRLQVSLHMWILNIWQKRVLIKSGCIKPCRLTIQIGLTLYVLFDTLKVHYMQTPETFWLLKYTYTASFDKISWLQVVLVKICGPFQIGPCLKIRSMRLDKEFRLIFAQIWTPDT